MEYVHIVLNSKDIELVEIAKQPVKQGSAFGCLSRYADPNLIPEEKGAWEREMVKKHENS